MCLSSTRQTRKQAQLATYKQHGAEECQRGRGTLCGYIFRLKNYTAMTCIICKTGVKYSGNTTDLFKHMKNHAKENEELQKRREEKNPPLPHQTDPGPLPRGRGHWQRPFSLTENIQVYSSADIGPVFTWYQINNKICSMTLTDLGCINSDVRVGAVTSGDAARKCSEG